jgi:hypothetical protein
VTAVLPEPVTVSELDRLRRENDNLRAMNTALLDELVAHDLVAARNHAEHPRTPEQLAVIAADSRARHTRHALNAIAAKHTQEQQ